MKRIITRVAPVLAFLASFVLVGCIGEPTSTDGTDESNLVSNRARNVANADENAAAFNAGPARALELKTRPSDANQGPHPEPWLDQEGPHPEPWQSKNIISAPEPDPNNGSKKP
jgi:hypothetical protein